MGGVNLLVIQALVPEIMRRRHRRGTYVASTMNACLVKASRPRPASLWKLTVNVSNVPNLLNQPY